MRDGPRLLMRLLVLAAVVMAVSACGGSAPSGSDAAAAPHFMKVDELAAGKLDALPTGSQFARILLFHQAPGRTFPSRKHQPGVIYVETGMQRLTYSDGQSVDVGAATAVYLRSEAHSHTNTSAVDNTWYHDRLSAEACA